MLAAAEKETLALALKYLDGQRACYQQALDALKLVLFVEGVDAASILAPVPDELVPAPDGSRVLVVEPEQMKRKVLVTGDRIVTVKPRARRESKARTGKRGGGDGSVSAAIIAMLSKKPGATPAEIATEVYGEASVRASRRAADMVKYLRRSGRLKKSVLNAQRKKSGAEKPKKKRAYRNNPATVKARTARKAGRKNLSAPPMLRCTVEGCGALIFERDAKGHLERHGVTADDAAVARNFTKPAERGEPLPVEA